MALPTAARCLVYLALIVAGALALDRALAARLFVAPADYVPAFRNANSYFGGERLVQLRGLRGRRLDGVFIGGSLVKYGADPLRFDARLRSHGGQLRTHNLAMGGQNAVFWENYFTRFWTGPPPRHLFLGVQARDVEHDGVELTEETIGGFFTSEGVANHDMSEVNYRSEEALARGFRLWGRRGEPHELTPTQLLAGERYYPELSYISNARGWARWQDPFDPRYEVAQSTLAAGRRRHGDRLGRPFRRSQDAFAVLGRLAAWSRCRGGHLFVFTLPILYDTEEWGGRRMHEGMARSLAELDRREPGMTFLDVGPRVQAAYTPADFGDESHMRASGARRFSMQLADAVSPVMRDLPGVPARGTEACRGELDDS